MFGVIPELQLIITVFTAFLWILTNEVLKTREYLSWVGQLWSFLLRLHPSWWYEFFYFSSLLFFHTLKTTLKELQQGPRRARQRRFCQIWRHERSKWGEGGLQSGLQIDNNLGNAKTAGLNSASCVRFTSWILIKYQLMCRDCSPEWLLTPWRASWSVWSSF